MPRGGSRPGAGRAKKPTKPAAVSKSEANEILDFLALKHTKHTADCWCLKCRWRNLSRAQDLRLRFQVEKSLLDRVLGLPAQTIQQNHSGTLTLEQLVCGAGNEE
jgi:hypothetical protein